MKLREAEASLLPPYVDLRLYARWARAMLLVTAAVAWIAVGVDLSELRLISTASGGHSIDLKDRAAQIYTNDFMMQVQLGLLAASGLAFVLWLFQARVNVRALGMRRLDYTRSWTWLAFLLPVVNLFRPYQVVREIWQASNPINLDAFNWKSLPVSRLLLVWWASFVGWGALEVLAFATGTGAGMNLQKLELASALEVAADTVAALSACLAYLLVGRISGDQDLKHADQARAGRADAA